MGRLDGKIALITGTGRGIGQAAAWLFAREGAVVVGCARNEDELKKTHLQLEVQGAKTAYKVADLSDESQSADLVRFALEKFGRIDILYNNAGSARMGGIFSLSSDDWNYTMRNELYPVYYMTKYVAPIMRDQKAGAIVNTSSFVALKGTSFNGELLWLAHAAAEAAIIAMTRSLADELGPHGVRINVMTLGGIENSAWHQFSEQFVNAHRKRMIDHQPLKRTGRNNDVAQCALFLSSDEADFITGQNFIVDGGISAV